MEEMTKRKEGIEEDIACKKKGEENKTENELSEGRSEIITMHS